MATLRKRRNKSGYVWDIDFRVNGKRMILSTKTSSKEKAKLILDDIQKKIALGKFKVAPEETETIKTVSIFFEEYFRVIAVKRKVGLLDNQRNYMRQFLKHVGDIDIKAITGKTMDEYRAARRATVRATTFDIERRFLHAAFQFAVKWGYLNFNPIKFLKKEKVPSKKYYLTADEKKLLFDSIDSFGKKLVRGIDKELHVLFKRAVIFLLNTGLRREELHQLERKHVDLAAKKIIVVNGVKGDKIRHIPLNDVTLEIMIAVGDNMFRTLDPSRFSKKFHKIAVVAGLKDIKLHSLRHTFATDLVERGVNIAVIQDLLGHSDIRTTLEYAKVNVEVKRSAVQSLSDGRAVNSDTPANVLHFPIQVNTKG